jgi:hypothetical protein
MAREQSGDALEAFRRYTQAFSSLDPVAAARHFHEPAISITPDRVVALPDAAAVVREYEGVMAQLRTAGYARTDFTSLAERRLADDLAVVTAVAAWKKESGEEMRRFGMTYTLRRTGGDWHIVVLAVHDPLPDR